MRTGLGLILIVAMLAATPANAEFYKYVDENGIIRFTDDITMVPREQREKLLEYQDSINESEDTPEASQAAPATAPEKTPEPASVGDFNQAIIEQGKRLEAQQAALDTEYKALMDARRLLEERRGGFRTKSARKEYVAQIIQLNKRNAAYEAKRAAYDNEVLQYNAELDQLRESTE